MNAPPAECQWVWPGQLPWAKVSDDCPAEEHCEQPNFAGWWIGQPAVTPCLA